MPTPTSARVRLPAALRGPAWFGAYLAVVVVPLIFAVIGVVDDGRGFWREFTVALGFVGLSMMGLQFVLVARVKVVAAPFGEDALVHFHRYMGYLATVLILAHPVLLIVLVNADYLERVNPFTAPWAGRFGTLAILCLLAVVVTSVWRAALRITYEVWQGLHLVLSTVAIVAALIHVELIGHYVNQPWKRVLWAVMTAGFLAVFVWVRIVRPVLRTRRPWTVASVRSERGGVHTVTLRPIGHGGFSFAPGQFGWLSVHRSPFALTQHPFSFSSNGDDRSALQMSIKELGDFTRTIKSIAPGTRAYVDGPHGVFSPDNYDGPGFVFLGGGVGIGPLMSILRTFATRGERRPCLLFFGVARIEDATFREEIDTLATRLPLTVVYVVSDPPSDWAGEQGRITTETLRRHLPREHETLQYFICGPGAMQDAMEDALGALKVPGAHVHTERFNFV
ncbi:ferric reductase-like transmembrane domain-containing protein [Mycobacterium sp. AZCC_0083]|uniref:ferredoxin reductase family protein n=1 Tax=Mycobacterium sp. AZCC_0083 TaxID=2735882 RepID=UPI00161ED3D4|nr:ferric reductase-like transmembrane domain-containing protein [Mycobacterium sp. AZCC_0083]MBB5164180.1 putative ferric reductase [Mycobacterium sp. AZCC_0083]